MRVLVSPDKFKGCLSAPQVADAIAEGLRLADPRVDVDFCPIADGGEGTRDALLRGRGGELVRCEATGASGARVVVEWARLADGTALIESAAVVGLEMLPTSQRDPRLTTSFGLGEVIRSALDAGVRRIVVGIGGTATTDGGAGMAQALGARFDGLSSPAHGGMLGDLRRIDLGGLDPRLTRVELVGACDVMNPLLGARGAAQAFAPQKGASPDDVLVLEAGLAELAALMEPVRPNLRSNVPGMGAGGGLGFGICALLGGELTSGAELVLQALGVDERLQQADLAITGEGSLDAQSLEGKAAFALARHAEVLGVPVVVLAGREALAPSELWAASVTAAFSICSGPMTLAAAEKDARRLLTARAAQILRLWAANRPD